MNSRYYDAETGRFINADAFASTDINGPLSANMFAYCENNPVNRSDPTGESFLFAVSVGMVGALSGAASQVLTNIATGQDWNNGIIAAAAGGAVYNVVSVVTGNLALASITSSATELTVNEISTYVSGQQEFNSENVMRSVANVAANTSLKSVETAALGKLSSKVIPINKGWFKPKKLKSCLLGKYAKKVQAQSGVQGLLTSLYNTTKSFFSKLH